MREFTEKYTQSGKIGNMLLDNYFKAIDKLLKKIDKEEIQNFRVLEVGCGAGYSTKRIRDMLPKGVDFSASDFEKENVAEAKKNLGEAFVVTEEDIYNLERKDKSIDLIFLLEVMEHLQSPNDALAELKRVGKKYVIIGVPREPIWRILNMLRLKYWSSLGNTPGHIQHWSKTSLLKFLKSRGFEVVAVENPLPWSIVLVRI
ncbi:class I SAM-dependent methyltransferase [Candidatus Dojkabacteria bacterium]|uniref:Class I SAM-dependent methyltransferase n=1 Tax=Candidatus Dojkabacteria bacterium TaxID=2099670 RepID=A0A847D254_9BACT|nr:class I SAM-dependent methyltransferase [Candidatus Dojkabacteria bacterium]